MPTYSLYLVRCRTGSVYTGIATDVARRLTEHDQGAKGAKYLRGKGPLTLIYEQEIGGRSLASKIEGCVKRLPKVDKENRLVLEARIREFIDQCDSVAD